MSRFFDKMWKLGKSLKKCWDFAAAPVLWDVEYFNRDEDAKGALLIVPTFLATCVTVACAAVAASVLVVTKGIIGGAVAAAQDIWHAGESIWQGLSGLMSSRHRAPGERVAGMNRTSSSSRCITALGGPKRRCSTSANPDSSLASPPVAPPATAPVAAAPSAAATVAIPQPTAAVNDTVAASPSYSYGSPCSAR